jgi:hypothetical protein
MDLEKSHEMKTWQDLFGDVDLFIDNPVKLLHLVVHALLKYRLLSVLKNDYEVTSLVLDIEVRINLAQDIERMEPQICLVYHAVFGTNECFWRTLLIPDDHLTRKTSRISIGSVEEMQITLQQL